ncbi:hypothetical protein FE257_005441 [Aspergillus nanangensis]|uniref:Uncharacterized protein n=1 Tax=Aspergillus nanangensis TaxID=2582783 RepID=A0AAD4CQK1_ASPNN|nr:hypothetical protein FE257_005441 [Aspergillus nanangensis]
MDFVPPIIGQTIRNFLSPETPCPEEELPAGYRMWIDEFLIGGSDFALNDHEKTRLKGVCKIFREEGHQICDNNTAIIEFMCYTYSRDMGRLWRRFKDEELSNKLFLQYWGDIWCAYYWQEGMCEWRDFLDLRNKPFHTGMLGTFQNELKCKDAWKEILNRCYDYSDGGTWTSGGITLTMNYCIKPAIFGGDLQTY